MTELFKETYMVFPRKCAQVRERMPEWHAVDAYQHRDADAAWRQVLSQAGDVGLGRPDPADYVIVGGAVTNDVNERGAARVVADWTRTFDPQSFHEEVERARQVREEAEADQALAREVDAMDLTLRLNGNLRQASSRRLGLVAEWHVVTGEATSWLSKPPTPGPNCPNRAEFAAWLRTLVA
jgi:hypothetical protein